MASSRSSWCPPTSSERQPSSPLFLPGVSLCWEGLAACLGVDDRQMLRWCHERLTVVRPRRRR